MTTASLELLKGAKKKALDAQLETKEAPVEAAAETEEVTVDIDKMTGKELDALVAEHEINTPADWKKMKVDEKKAWLKAEFGDETPAEETPEETPEEEPAEEQAPEEEEVAAEAPKEEPKPKGKTTIKKKGSTSTALAASTTKSGEVMAPDAISDIAQEIENLKEGDARAMIGQLAEATELTYFKLGGVLSLIKANGWYQPYENFRSYVEGEHGIEYRKAMYLISIYNDIIESGVSWDKVKHIGWTKLKEIASILTQDNVDEWVEKAGKHTTIQLSALVAQHKKGTDTAQLSATNASEITTKTFKLHQDQRETVEAALEKAKKVANTDVDTAALEFICLEYLNMTGKKPAKVDLPKELQKLGIEEAAEAFQKAYPDATLNIEV